MKVLVTGGAGSLGRALVGALAREGHAARVMGRRARTASAPAAAEWAVADLSTGEWLGAAVGARTRSSTPRPTHAARAWSEGALG